MNKEGIESIWIDIQGFRTHCLHAGEQGEVLILLHGAGVDSAKLSWAEVIVPLAENCRVYAIDLPGYGETGYLPHVEYSNSFYVQFVKQFMDQMNIQKATIIGLSMGGGIAIEFALTFPRRVNTLGLVCAYGLMEKWQWHFLTYHLYVNTPLNTWSYAMVANSRWMLQYIIQTGLFYERKNVTEQLIDEIQEAAKKPNSGHAFASFQKSEYLDKSGVRSNFIKRLSEVFVPTLVVHGRYDRSVPVKYAYQAQKLLPNGQLAIIDNARHWPQKEKPQQFVAVVRKFLHKQGLIEM